MVSSSTGVSRKARTEIRDSTASLTFMADTVALDPRPGRVRRPGHSVRPGTADGSVAVGATAPGAGPTEHGRQGGLGGTDRPEGGAEGIADSELTRATGGAVGVVLDVLHTFIVGSTSL
jgi:hypothetical protein